MVLTLANSTFFWWYPSFAKLGFWWLWYKSSITCYGRLPSLTPCLRIVTVLNSFPSHRDGFRIEIHFILKEDLWNLFVSLYTTCPEGDDLTGYAKSFGGNIDDHTMPWTRYSASMRGHPLVFPERRTVGNGARQHRFQWYSQRVCVSSLSSLNSKSWEILVLKRETF